MRDYALHMRIVEFLHGMYPKVHISLQTGELVSGLVMPADLCCHIRLALEHGHAERIGHGTDIAFEDDSTQLLDELVKRNTVVEICLTSDDLVLGIRGNEHPLPLYLQRGVAVVLATNDAGVLRTDLGQEFVLAAQRYKLSYEQLKLMVRQSLEHSFLPGASMWADIKNDEIAGPCASDLPNRSPASPACETFLKSSEKARLQWKLEEKLLTFEAEF